MTNQKVSYEINVEADTPLEAAYELLEIFRDHNHNGQYYVQEYGKSEVFSVDLDEPDEDAVLPVKVYEPFIQPTHKVENLKLAIDQESVNIYIDNGDDQEPTQIVYWHLDEVEEDATVAISIANAINLYHTNQKELVNLVSLNKL